MTCTPVGSGIDALVFDFYGTLAHAPGFGIEIGLEVILASIDLPLDREAFVAGYRRAVERYWREVAAVGLEQHNTVWVAAGLEACGHHAGPDDPVVVAAVAAYFDRFATEMRWLDGVEEALARLEERFPIALLSNFTDPLPVRRLLGQDGWIGRFAVVSISAEIGRRKPHPDVFADVVARLGTRPERTLHVGDDRLDDVFGARTAGLKTAWIRGSVEPSLQRQFARARAAAFSPEAAATMPDHTLAGVSELPALLLAG